MFDVDSMSEGSSSGVEDVDIEEYGEEERERGPLPPLPMLLQTNNNHNVADIAMNLSVNVDSYVNSNYTESGSYRYVYRP